jgi:hypothetical protein
MMVRLRVAGLTLAAHAPRPCRALALPAPTRTFAAGSGRDIRLEVSEAPPPLPVAGSLLFESGGLWRVHRHGARLLYLFHEPRPGAELERALDIDARWHAGTLYLPRPHWRQRPGFALGYPLDELLFQHRLAHDGALEVHGCGLDVGGRAVIFCGRSGAGKTTTARLWTRRRPGTAVLSDDRMVLRAQGRAFGAHGTPWHGSGRYAQPRARPLAALFFLHHAPASRAERMTTVEAAGEIFARAFPPPWDARVTATVLATCARVAAAVPCFRLGFVPDGSAVEVVEEALAGRRR